LGGYLFFDLASHQIDSVGFSFLVKFGQASGISRAIRENRYDAEVFGFGKFVFENGILGSGNWCFTSAVNSRNKIQIPNLMEVTEKSRFRNLWLKVSFS